MLNVSGPRVPVAGADLTARAVELRKAAQGLEARFVAEMLRASGLGETSESFGGGAGEDQFASLQRDLLAQEIVERKGFGLTQVFMDALKERDGE